MKTVQSLSLAATLGAAAVLAPAAARAQNTQPPAAQEVDVIEKAGNQVPLDRVFTDENGRPVKLGDYFTDGKPVVLVLVYFTCPMLCELILRGVIDAMKGIDWIPGKEFRLVTVSIDPRDDPARARDKQRYVLATYGRPDVTAGWPFLTGKEEDIRAVADSVGYRYAFDEATGEYAHPAVVVALTPGGKVSHYLYGVGYPSRDFKFALMEASDGKIGSIFDRVIITCYKYDPATRRYGPYVFGFIRIGGAIIGLLVLALVVTMWRLERRRRRA